MRTATYGAPINPKSISDTRRRYFAIDDPPALFPFTVTFACETVPSLGFPTNSSLRRVSPEEQTHAAYFAIHDAIKEHGNDDSLMRGWLRCLRNVPMKFLKAPVEDWQWLGLQMREDAVEMAETVGRTTLQRIYDIIRVKHELEVAGKKSNADTISALFMSKLKIASSTETVNKTFVDSALTVWNRMLSQPQAADILKACDTTWGLHSPWNSVYKLQEVISRAQVPDAITWMLASLTDGVTCGTIAKGELTVRNIGDRGTKYWGGMANLRRDLLTFLLTTYLDKDYGWNASVKAKFRSCLQDHASVRKALTPAPGMEDLEDLTWQRDWPESAKTALELFEVLSV